MQGSFFGIVGATFVNVCIFNEIVEGLTKLKNWDFFQSFYQRMGLLPQQLKNTNIFVCFTTLRPKFIILLSKNHL